MPDLIYCPQCERQLRVPDELRGRSVKCPTCGTIFTAPTETPRPLDEFCADEDEPNATATYQQDESDGEAPPRTRQRRIDLKPHRGTLILVLGIFSIVFCGFLGPVAWIMGGNDLRQMRAGRMDPEGEGLTNGGRICGIIGTFVQLVMPLCCGIPATLLWFSHRVAGHHGGF
jgi:predicted Zn finger-like uncharacterized protein